MTAYRHNVGSFQWKSATPRCVFMMLVLLVAAGCSDAKLPNGLTATESPNESTNATTVVTWPTVSDVTKHWQVKPGTHMETGPTYADGVVYVTQEDSCICALDAGTGRVIWQVPPPGVGMSEPVVANGALYFAVRRTTYLYALDASTGDGKWSFNTGNPLDEYGSKPIVADGIVYFTSGWYDATGRNGSGGYINALDADTGRLIWQVKTKGSQNGINLADGLIYFGDGEEYDQDTDTLHSVDAKTGKEKWHTYYNFKLGWLQPHGGLLYFVDGGGQLLGVDTQSGQEKWRLPKKAEGDFFPPIFTQDTLYVAVDAPRSLCIDNCGPGVPHNDTLYALDRATTGAKWKLQLTNEEFRDLRLHDGVLYYTTFRPDYLKAVDASTGQPKWQFEGDDAIFGVPAFADGLAYFGTSSATVYGLQLPGYPVQSLKPRPKATQRPAATGTMAAVSEAPMRGFQAPDFDLAEVRTGGHVRLSSLKGRPVLLNFWGTWCPPCKKEMPEIQKLYSKYKGQIEFVGVSSGLGDDLNKVKNYIGSGQYDWTFVHDYDGVVSGQYQALTIPITFFIDKEGVIGAIHIGEMDGAQIEGYLNGIK